MMQMIQKSQTRNILFFIQKKENMLFNNEEKKYIIKLKLKSL